MILLLINKRILITGGGGFLGARVVKLLNEDNILFIPRSSQYDLTKEENVIKLYKDYSDIDIVIHMASDVGGIGYSSKRPAKQYYKNTLLNTYILHYSWENEVEKFVGIGSVCEYPSDTPVPFKEGDLWNGYPVETNDAYGLTKRMLLAQSIAYKKEYNFNAIHLLPVNLYGPGDDFDLQTSHVIPALIRKISEAKQNNFDSVSIWGTGQESREFLYVDDAAEAILLATEKYNDIEPVNLGVGEEIKICDLAELLRQLIGYQGDFVFSNNGLGGQKRRVLDVQAANTKFGFTAKTPLIEGLQETIKYYEDNIK